MVAVLGCKMQRVQGPAGGSVTNRASKCDFLDVSTKHILTCNNQMTSAEHLEKVHVAFNHGAVHSMNWRQNRET